MTVRAEACVVDENIDGDAFGLRPLKQPLRRRRVRKVVRPDMGLDAASRNLLG
jgi:hypothetical protein